MLNVPMLIDLMGSVAILAVLAAAYGALHRLMQDRQRADLVLGGLFGLVAMVQMHSPVTLMEGLIVDMRNTPVVLAGAFLGLRGLLPCLLIAALVRLQIGGVGAPAGLLAIGISGAIGVAWHAYAPQVRRNWQMLAFLGLATPINLISVVLLPTDIAIWFLSTAMVPLALLYVVTIPLLAGLMERERWQMRQEADLRRDVNFMEGDGLMGRKALDWALRQAASAGPLAEGASVVAIRIRFAGALQRLWGEGEDYRAMKTFRARLEAVMPPGGVIGRGAEDLVLMVVPRMDAEMSRLLLTRIRRDVSGEAIALPGCRPFRLVLDQDVTHYDALPALGRIVGDVTVSDRRRDGLDLPVSVGGTEPADVDVAAHERTGPIRLARQRTVPEDRRLSSNALFSTFDRMIADRAV